MDYTDTPKESYYKVTTERENSPIDVCITEVFMEARSLARHWSHISDSTLASMAWEKAKKKHALYTELEFFGEDHPYYCEWLSKQDGKYGTDI